ncbi:hypothetical protein ACFPYJ_07710 [Paenibacillus solisilvae]|uniref:Uncharacterized protein n=1 Tax=Paenibacillus solisilvae TaxID=2486751 RepID=A0ABW0VWY3_9BACL
MPQSKFVGPVKTYGTDPNDWIAVLSLTYVSKNFLFTEDAEARTEVDMIKSKQSLLAMC